MSAMSKKVLPIVRGVRKIVAPHFGKAAIFKHKDGSGHNLVTKLDRAAEKYLRSQLSKAYPDIGFVGEEFGGDRSAKRFWLCDPIDGTQLFIRGMEGCTTMLALIDGGEVVFSAIYDFVNDIMYHAEEGKGAYMNGKKIHVSTRAPRLAMVCHEISYTEFKTLRKLRKHALTIHQYGAGCEFILVATGAVEARIGLKPSGQDWDYAPGMLLVKEAGGIVTNIGSKKYDYRITHHIAASPSFYRAITGGKKAVFPIKKGS